MSKGSGVNMTHNLNSCNICGGKFETILNLASKEIYGMGKNYIQNVCICNNCGFIFTQNPFFSELLDNRYKLNSKFEFDDDECIHEDSTSYKNRCKRQYNFICENIDNNFSGIVEIGSASGYNLSLYTNKKRYGIEPSALNCKLAKSRYNVDMFAGTYDEYQEYISKNNCKNAYDLVFLSHTLEHIVNPCTFIQNCVDSFDNKYFFVEVPCFDIKFEDGPFGMFCEEHVNYFTLEALENLFLKVGFSLVEAEYFYDYEGKYPAAFPSICTLFEKKEPIFPYKRPIISSKTALEMYIESSKNRMSYVCEKIDSIPDSEKLVVWGTGHLTSMLLANTSLDQKSIVKYYDSDIRKKGTEYNGRLITPFDLNDIEEKNIDSVLIGSYVYQQEIFNLLEPYKDKIKIYKLFDIAK